MNRGLTAPFREFVSMYLEQVATLSYANRRVQSQFRASLAHGGAGLAYSLLRIHERTRDDALLETARVWLDSSLAGARRGALRARNEPGRFEASFLHGRAGIHFVRAKNAKAIGDRDGLAHEAASFCDFAERDAQLDELHLGAAGFLAGACALHRTTKHARVLDIVAALTRRLTRVDSALGEPAWASLEASMLAHGRAGIAYALLDGLATAGMSTPSWLDGVLDRIHAASMSPPPEKAAWMRGSNCNGLAGTALLWVRAFELHGSPRYLERALETVDVCTDRSSISDAQLCCGVAGRAYALLAIDRIAPDRSLRDRAMELAAPWLGPIASEWPLGVQQGYAGVACLASDLSSKRSRVRYPIFGD